MKTKGGSKNSEEYSSNKNNFHTQAGLDADENPVAHAAYSKLPAKEKISKPLQEIRTDFSAIKNELD